MFCNVCCTEIPYRKCAWPRDELNCIHCGSCVRQRALYYVFQLLFPTMNDDLVVHQSSPGNTYFDNIFKGYKNYSFSQYFPGVPTGQYHNGVLCADIDNLPFPSDSIDVFYTLDVFEHLFEPVAALKEIYRVLKPGGYYLMTVPLERQYESTEKACYLDETNTLVHTPTEMSKAKGVELEYHGNPIDQTGSVVTYYYGYDLVETIKNNTPFEVQVFFHNGDLLPFGIEGIFKDVFVCKKNLVP